MEEVSKLEERIRNRRQRRWKRRGRIIAPFAALPLLVAALMLSVDIIEYAPQEPRENKPVAQPIVKPPKRIQPSLAAAAAMSASALVGQDVLEPAPDESPDLRLPDDKHPSTAVPIPGLPIDVSR